VTTLALAIVAPLVLALAANGAASAPGSPAAAQPEAPSRAASVISSPTSSKTSPPAVVVSRQLLERRGLKVGQIVSFSSEPSGTGAKPFRIAGVYEPTPDPMKLTADRLEARFHLPDLLAMTDDRTDPLSAESVSAINVALLDPSDAPRFASDLKARIPGIVAFAVRDAFGDGNPFATLERFHLAIAIVTVIGSSAFLLALMVMRADERRETAGILRLIGLSRGRILVEILFEGLLIAVAGAAFGILFAAAV